MMSYRERRTRKDRRGKTPGQLRAWYCICCMRKIRHSEIRRGQVSGVAPFAMSHVICPPKVLWPWTEVP